MRQQLNNKSKGSKLKLDEQEDQHASLKGKKVKQQQFYCGKRIFFAIFIFLLIVFFIISNIAHAHPSIPNKSIKILTLHEPKCYSQGFSFINKTHILESCGLYRQSYFAIYQYDRQEQKLVTKHIQKIADKYFAEGVVYFPKNNMIYMITWREKVVFRFDATTYQEVDQLKWNSTGWGLTQNGTHLFVTDGGDKIYLVDEDFKTLESKKITHNGYPLQQINQLEWRLEEGRQIIYANVYYSNKIFRIDYQQAKVTHFYDQSILTKHERPKKSDFVLNGIAYDEQESRFMVTGKKWQHVYQMVGL